MGYGKIHRNLFPNSNYPEVALVIVQPGASAKTMASNIAVPVEEELYASDEIRRAYSNTIDEVTVIRAEFEYSKNVDTAVNDVTTALSKIRSKLPNRHQRTTSHQNHGSNSSYPCGCHVRQGRHSTELGRYS